MENEIIWQGEKINLIQKPNRFISSLFGQNEFWSAVGQIENGKKVKVTWSINPQSPIKGWDKNIHKVEPFDLY